jgi:hypothetical protein
MHLYPEKVQTLIIAMRQKDFSVTLVVNLKSTTSAILVMTFDPTRLAQHQHSLSHSKDELIQPVIL